MAGSARTVDARSRKLGSGYAPPEKLHQSPRVRCAECGGSMRPIAVVYVPCRTLVPHALAYLDSG
jgi:hypothetical protein